MEFAVLVEPCAFDQFAPAMQGLDLFLDDHFGPARCQLDLIPALPLLAHARTISKGREGGFSFLF